MKLSFLLGRYFQSLIRRQKKISLLWGRGEGLIRNRTILRYNLPFYIHRYTMAHGCGGTNKISHDTSKNCLAKAKTHGKNKNFTAQTKTLTTQADTAQHNQTLTTEVIFTAEVSVSGIYCIFTRAVTQSLVIWWNP